MFNKSQLNAYNNIKAPDELFEKVANAEPKKSKIYLIPLVSSLAACLILIFGIASFSSFSAPKVTFNGQDLSESVVFYDISPANILDMRSSPVLSLPVDLELKSTTEVAVSEGVILLNNGERAQSKTLEGDVSLVWEIQRTGDFPQCTMTLGSNGKTTTITLTQNETDGSFTATIN